MEIRVTYRTTQETAERLRGLAEKYGLSQSALLSMLVNERWLMEGQGGKTGTFGGEHKLLLGEAPNVPESDRERSAWMGEEGEINGQKPAFEGKQADNARQRQKKRKRKRR